MTTIAERVAAGAAFLDQHDPRWWRPDVDRAIDLDCLDLSREDLCVLGQRCPLDVLHEYGRSEWGSAEDADRFDRYQAYANVLFASGSHRDLAKWAYERGFTRPPEAGRWNQWDALTAEWKRVITARREAQP